MTSDDDELLDFEGGTAAPPRENGELVFDAPWQMRAFGLAAELVDAGRFSWRDVQGSLIDVIAEWEASDPATRGVWVYYERWLEAVERLVVGRDVLSSSELGDRAAEYAARPHGHDH